MEQITQWRARPMRAGRVHRRHAGGRRLRAAAAAGAMVAVTMPALSADGAVGAGRSIEVFTETDMIGLAGYPPNTRVKVEVVRHGFVVGYTTRLTDSLGGFEINHAGGLAGDCFQSPTSPDVQPTDTIRATVLEPGGVRDSSVVRGVWLDDVEFGTTTITVTGRVSVDGPGAVDPAADLLELRVNTSDDEIGTEDPDLREEIGSDVQEDGTWTHVITTTADVVTAARADSETVLEWSDASSTEMTIGEFGVPEPIEGCPPRGSEPTAPLLLASQDSGKAGDHRTNQATGLTFSGLAGTGLDAESGADQTVRLQVDGADFGEVTADSDGVYEFTGVDLAARATPHTVRVISPEGDASRTVRVDTTAPGVRVRSFGPSPLHLTGVDQLRAVYRVSESATLRARIDHIHPTRLVRAFAKRTVSRDGLAEFTWNGTNVTERNVRPGRYQVVVEVTDKVGNVTVQRNLLRVVR